MTSTPASIAETQTHATPSLRHVVHCYNELAKARLTAMVVFTAMVGYIVAGGALLDWRFLWTLMGVALAGGAANTFNQVFERHRDAQMTRTQGRPLPSGMISPLHATIYGMFSAVASLVILAWGVNMLAASLAMLTLSIYVFAYTPLKVRSTANTLVGAVVGAIPPMIGWSAVTGGLETGAWLLAGILFAWQMPHFLALAWMYRRDYELGGFRMLPMIDPHGRLTAKMALLYCGVLILLGLAAGWYAITGWLFVLSATILGLWFMRSAWVWWKDRSDQKARRLFLASVMYLPLLLTCMIVDHLLIAPSAELLPHAIQISAVQSPQG